MKKWNSRVYYDVHFSEPNHLTRCSFYGAATTVLPHARYTIIFLNKNDEVLMTVHNDLSKRCSKVEPAFHNFPEIGIESNMAERLDNQISFESDAPFHKLSSSNTYTCLCNNPWNSIRRKQALPHRYRWLKPL
jgi:hypothetical protein